MVPPVTNGNVTGYSTEYAWDDWQCSPNPNAFVGGASGGGQSLFYPMPTWQQGKTTNDIDRDVPDVSLYADPFENTWPPTCPSVFDGGYYVNIENVWTRLGGTSVAAPIWAGIFALIEQKLSSRLGLVNPELYNLENTSAFHQVTTGNNMWNLVAGYNAGAGYNRVTGLGTPDGAQLVASFVGGVNPTPEPTAFPALIVHVVATPNPLPTERAFIPNGGTRNGDNGDVNIFEATPGFALGNLVQDFQNLGSPLDVAFNATGSTVYMLEGSGSNVDTITTSTAPYVLNLDKYSAVAVFGSSIALKGSNLYVTDAEEQSLTVVPTGGGAYTHIAVGPNPGQVVTNPQKSFVYVSNSSGNSVSVVETTTNAVTQTIPVGSNPVHLAVTSDGATLFVANQGAGTVTQINVGVTPAVVQRTYFVGGEPTGIAVNANNTIAYVTNSFCPNNPTGCTGNNQSNGVVEQIVFSPIGIQPVRCCLVVGQLPVADAFDPSGQYLWVIESGSFEATVIDTFTNQIYGNFSTGAAVGEEWTGVGNFVHAVPH